MAVQVETPVIDNDKLMEFIGKVVGELGAAVNAGLIVIGDRLGLYRSLAEAGPTSAGELAKRSGTTERYVHEWLNAQAAGGYVNYDPATDRYFLSAEQALALADEFQSRLRRRRIPTGPRHAEGDAEDRERLQDGCRLRLARA